MSPNEYISTRILHTRTRRALEYSRRLTYFVSKEMNSEYFNFCSRRHDGPYFLLKSARAGRCLVDGIRTCAGASA